MFNRIKAFLGLNEYISELDLFLKHFDKTEPHLSIAEREEADKYSRIFTLRDSAESPKAKPPFWDKF